MLAHSRRASASCDKQTYDTAVTTSKNGVQNKFALWGKNFRKANKASL